MHDAANGGSEPKATDAAQRTNVGLLCKRADSKVIVVGPYPVPSKLHCYVAETELSVFRIEGKSIRDKAAAPQTE